MQYSPCSSLRNPPFSHFSPRCRAAVRPATPFTHGSLVCSGDHSSSGLSGAATAGGQGSGDGGNKGTPGRPTRFDPEGSKPGRGSHRLTWLKVLGLALGSFATLGLLEPWSYITPSTPIDTSYDSVAIIIPVLNESGGILDTLRKLHQLTPPVHEIIVVDGGSTDGTIKLVKRSGLATKVLSAPRGRASQMNVGADAATADMLCFLHADSLPPKDLVTIMRRELSDQRVVLAGFSPCIEDSGRKLRAVSTHNWLKTYYVPAVFRPVDFLRGLRLLFGDQALFCRASDFQFAGKYDPNLSIMEDADLCIRMHHVGHARIRRVEDPCSSRSTQQLPRQRQRHAAAYTALSKQQEPTTASHVHDDQSASPYLLSHMWQSLQQFLQPRGRVKQVLDRECVTSGRRIAVWGSWRATYIHYVITVSWYFGKNPQQLKELYHEMYTDSFR